MAQEFYWVVSNITNCLTSITISGSDSLNAVVLEKLSYCTVNIECLFAEITDSTGVKVVYGVVYRPPSGCFEAFCEVLQTIAKQLSGKPLRLLGDFNSDLFKVSSHNQLFEDTIISNGLYPSISIATHFRPNCKNSCIDNILVSDIDNVMLSGVLQDRLSEHSLIFSFTSTQAPRNKNDEKHVRYYDYSSAKLKNFVSELEVKVNQLSQSSDFCEFVDCFKSTLDKHCKLEVPKTTKRTPKLNPWITDGIILSIDRKHELCKEWSDTVTNKDPSGNVLLYMIFSDYRRMLKGIIKAAKRSYYCNEIYKNIESSKKTWQIINELRGKRKKTTKPPFIINNERILNRRAIANGFNSWFVSIAPKLNETITTDLSSGIPILPMKTFHDFLSPSNSRSIMLEDTTPEEVLRIIKEFENGKASDIPITVIKTSSHVIAPIVSRYLNKLMSNGIFPDILKTGRRKVGPTSDKIWGSPGFNSRTPFIPTLHK